MSYLREKCPNTEFFSGPYFPVFSSNTGKYGPEKSPYLHTFHAVHIIVMGLGLKLPCENFCYLESYFEVSLLLNYIIIL